MLNNRVKADSNNSILNQVYIADDKEPYWITVLVELLLSLLSQPNKLARVTANITFRMLCPNINAQSMQLMLDVRLSLTFTYLHLPSLTFTYLHLPSLTFTYLHLPSLTFIAICTLTTNIIKILILHMTNIHSDVFVYVIVAFFIIKSLQFI